MWQYHYLPEFYPVNPQSEAANRKSPPPQPHLIIMLMHLFRLGKANSNTNSLKAIRFLPWKSHTQLPLTQGLFLRVCASVCMHTCVPVCVPVCACAYLCVCVCIFVCVCACVCVCVGGAARLLRPLRRRREESEATVPVQRRPTPGSLCGLRGSQDTQTMWVKTFLLY